MIQTASASKQVQVIARIQFKRDARKVVYFVRSSDGTQTYKTCFFNGRACSCNCAARGLCYHMFQLEAIEIKRQATPCKAISQATAIVEAAQADAQASAYIRYEMAIGAV